MLDNLTDLNGKIQEKCELMSAEQDGDRLVVLAGELERLFEEKDLIVQDRNRVYRQNRILPSATVTSRLITIGGTRAAAVASLIFHDSAGWRE